MSRLTDDHLEELDREGFTIRKGDYRLLNKED